MRAALLLHRWVQGIGRNAVTLALLGIMALLSLGVFIRVYPFLSIAGYDEIVELLVAWMTFLGAAVLWGEGSLYRVDVLADRLPPWSAWVVALIVRLLMLLFAVVFSIEGWQVAVRSADISPFLRFPKSYAYASMPVAGLVMMAYSLGGLRQALIAFRRQR